MSWSDSLFHDPPLCAQNMAAVFLRPKTKCVWGWGVGELRVILWAFFKASLPRHSVVLYSLSLLDLASFCQPRQKSFCLLWLEGAAVAILELPWGEVNSCWSRTREAGAASPCSSPKPWWAGPVRENTRGHSPADSSAMEKRLTAETHQVLPPAGTPSWKLHFPQCKSRSLLAPSVGNGHFFNICPFFGVFVPVCVSAWGRGWALWTFCC